MTKLLVASAMLLFLMLSSIDSMASSNTSVKTTSPQVNQSDQGVKYTFTLFSFFDSYVSNRVDSSATKTRSGESQNTDFNR